MIISNRSDDHCLPGTGGETVGSQGNRYADLPFAVVAIGRILATLDLSARCNVSFIVASV
jgi:hypothetical protein